MADRSSRLLYPDAFIRIAEMGFDGSLAINIPPSALTEASVPERLLEIIAGSGLEPGAPE